MWAMNGLYTQIVQVLNKLLFPSILPLNLKASSLPLFSVNHHPPEWMLPRKRWWCTGFIVNNLQIFFTYYCKFDSWKHYNVVSLQVMLNISWKITLSSVLYKYSRCIAWNYHLKHFPATVRSSAGSKHCSTTLDPRVICFWYVYVHKCMHLLLFTKASKILGISRNSASR